jgi:HEPN domain-containing protein
MMPHEEAMRKIVAEWVHKADQDFAAAEHLLSQEQRFSGIVAFHCQQAAEKYLKALLTCWDIEFPKTHVLAELLDLVDSHDAELATSLRDAVVLTPYGVLIRYPGDRPEASPAEAREAVELARKVRQAVLPLLPSKPGEGKAK